MSGAATPGVVDAIGRERLRLHADNAATSGAATLLAASALVALCWGRLGGARLALWWLALVALMLVRWRMSVRQRRAGIADASPRWLVRHRLTFALHGLIWCALSLWVLPDGGHRLVEPVAFATVAMAGAALVTGAFDPRAALLFVAPAVLPLWVRLGLLGETDLLAAGMAFVAMMGVASRRASAHFEAQVAAVVAEDQRVQEARRSADDAEAARRDLADQHALLRQLIDGTSQGYWFVAPDGRTLDVNPAMCRLLGRTREQLLTLHVSECFTGPERAVLERELERRRSGHKGGYEVDVVRPDGSRAHAYNHATPIYRGDGSHMGSIGLWTDLTPQRRLEVELRTYERVTQSITDMVSVVGRDGRLLLVNDAWCESAGVAREQALGRRVAEHPLQLDPADPLGALERCLSGAGAQTVMVDAPRPGGTVARLQTRCYPYRGDDADADVRAAILVTRDVSAQHEATERLRHREAELRALFDAFPGYIAAVDDDMRYVLSNRRAEELLGRTGDELLGLHVEDVRGPVAAQLARAEMDRAAAGEVVTLERDLPATDAHPARTIEITHLAGPPDPEGRRVYYSFGIDITSRQRALEALAAARDEAERANLAKTRFLSHMSHELRTPLNAITGFAQLLERDRRAPVAAHQQRWVAQILRGGQHLSQLIGEVLDLARVEAGQLAVDPASLPVDEVTDECLSFVRELARHREVRLHPARRAADRLQLTVWADRTRLKQVLLNLLSNAIKYNRPGGEVELDAESLGPRVRIWVRDTGPGLTAEQQARLFQAFERLGAERGTIEGSGIGLLVSRHLVEAMGGSIGVDSAVGRGSTFWVELPAGDPPAPAAAVATASASVAAVAVGDASGPVLCVDDNPVNLMLLQAMLDEACGLRAATVSAPADALPQARALRPRLVLLDIHMPGLSGYDVLTQLRADPLTADVPVVAVSADAHAHEIETARAAGFDDYLTKPIELDALRATVERLLHVTVMGAP
ncbi:MAG: PAS domain S-box protein [Rubrivivax sp.]